MLKLNSRPESLLHSDRTFSFFFYKNDWYALVKNGLGYFGELVDGRFVYSTARKNRTCQDTGAKYNLIDEYNQVKNSTQKIEIKG